MTLCCLELDFLGGVLIYLTVCFFYLNVWIYRSACFLILKFTFDKSKLEWYVLVLSVRFCGAVKILLNTNNGYSGRSSSF